MASSGSFQNTFATGYTLRVEWKTNSQSIEYNSSNITVTAYLVSSGSSYTINSTGTKTVKLYINGETYTKSAAGLASLSGGQKKELYSKTVNIGHGADGSKSIKIACDFGIAVALSGTSYGTVRAPSGSNTFNTATLDTIPRATIPTTSGTWNVGSTVTISTSSRASTSFTHTIQYSLNNSSWTNIASGVTTSTTWTLPAALANAKPNATSGTVYIKCITHNGITTLGTETISRTYNIASSNTAPTVTLSVSHNYGSLISNYVRGKSRITLTASATMKNGASAAKYVFTYGGTTQTVSTSNSSSSISFALPSNAAASYPISVTVTDTRGYTGTYSTTITTLAYSAPTITSATVTRGNGASSSAFVENSKGNNLRISFSGNITSLSNANTKDYKIEYRPSNSTTYTTLIYATALSSYSFSVTQYTGAIFSENSSYVVRVSVSDIFETVSQIIDVPSQKVLLNFSANGKAMAIGGIASVDDTLEIMTSLYATGGIKPMQLANGTDFDEIVKPGMYIGNAASGGYVNPPVSTGTFILEVSSAGSAGQIMQRYSYCNKTLYRAYVRFMYESSWGNWQPTEGFTAFNTTGYAGQVRFANGFMVQWGRVSMATPTANTTVSVDITYPIAFTHAPVVHAHAHTSAPTVLSVSVGTGSTTGTTIYLTRANTTGTWVSWIAIGKG